MTSTIHNVLDRLRRRVCIVCEEPSTSLLCRPCALREMATIGPDTAGHCQCGRTKPCRHCTDDT